MCGSFRTPRTERKIRLHGCICNIWFRLLSRLILQRQADSVFAASSLPPCVFRREIASPSRYSPSASDASQSEARKRSPSFLVCIPARTHHPIPPTCTYPSFFYIAVVISSSFLYQNRAHEFTIFVLFLRPVIDKPLRRERRIRRRRMDDAHKEQDITFNRMIYLIRRRGDRPSSGYSSFYTYCVLIRPRTIYNLQ